MKFIDEDINNYQYMYIISNDKGYIKVGISKNPKRRLKQLQTGNQNKLTLLFTEEFEDLFHEIVAGIALGDGLEGEADDHCAVVVEVDCNAGDEVILIISK